jgi:hypothetical protein
MPSPAEPPDCAFILTDRIYLANVQYRTDRNLAALPLADGVADVTLGPHMLYHVPDRMAAAREFRRVTRLVQTMPDVAAFAAAVAARTPLGPDGRFRVRTHPGVLLCR